MKNIRVILVVLFLTGCYLPAFAGDVDPREMAIDLAVGGMEEGSRPLSDGMDEDKIPGAGLSPGMDTRVTASAAGPGVFTPDVRGQGDTSIIDANVDPNLGGDQSSVEADATIDANAGGEILDADTTVTSPDDTGTTIGANLDDTTSGFEGDATVETGPSDEGISEPAGTEDRSIIEADATVDTTGGTPAVDADVSLDTSAEDGLVDADAATTADIVDQELTSDAGVQIDMGDSTTLLESALGNEIGTSTAPPDAEADAGLEADIEGTGSGDDVAADPADGLSTGL
jgi:hypothetical protein